MIAKQADEKDKDDQFDFQMLTLIHAIPQLNPKRLLDLSHKIPRFKIKNFIQEQKEVNKELNLLKFDFDECIKNLKAAIELLENDEDNDFAFLDAFLKARHDAQMLYAQKNWQEYAEALREQMKKISAEQQAAFDKWLTAFREEVRKTIEKEVADIDRQLHAVNTKRVILEKELKKIMDAIFNYYQELARGDDRRVAIHLSTILGIPLSGEDDSVMLIFSDAHLYVGKKMRICLENDPPQAQHRRHHEEQFAREFILHTVLERVKQLFRHESEEQLQRHLAKARMGIAPIQDRIVKQLSEKKLSQALEDEANKNFGLVVEKHTEIVKCKEEVNDLQGKKDKLEKTEDNVFVEKEMAGKEEKNIFIKKEARNQIKDSLRKEKQKTLIDSSTKTTTQQNPVDPEKIAQQYKKIDQLTGDILREVPPVTFAAPGVAPAPKAAPAVEPAPLPQDKVIPLPKQPVSDRKPIEPTPQVNPAENQVADFKKIEAQVDAIDRTITPAEVNNSNEQKNAPEPSLISDVEKEKRKEEMMGSKDDETFLEENNESDKHARPQDSKEIRSSMVTQTSRIFRTARREDLPTKIVRNQPPSNSNDPPFDDAEDLPHFKIK